MIRKKHGVDVMEWLPAQEHVIILFHFLCGTGTTLQNDHRARLPVGISVARLREAGKLPSRSAPRSLQKRQNQFHDLLLDPLTTQPHDPDVKALLHASSQSSMQTII